MGKLSRRGIITDVILQKDNRPPILVNFENGAVEPNDADAINFNLHRGQTTKEMMVSTTCENIAYRGMCKGSQLRRFLAIRNKATNEVKLVEAASCTLSPLFGKKVIAKLEMSDKEIKGELAKAYGTKARRLKAILDETLKLDSEAVKFAASNVEIIKEEPSKELDSVFDILPPHDRDVKTIEEVYKLEDILIRDIQNCFQAEVQRIMNTTFEELKSEKFSDFFFAAWRVIQYKQDVSKKILNLKSLLYIECLGNLLYAGRPLLKKPDFSICYFSKALNTYILDKFTSQAVTGRVMSNADRDKALCYVLVLCFLMFDYKIELSTIIKVTHSSMTRLKLLSRVVGAAVNKDNLAVLRIPLSAPPISRANKRNKK